MGRRRSTGLNRTGAFAPLLGSPGHWPGPSGDPPLGMGKAPELFRMSTSRANALSIPSGQWPDGTGESPVPPAPISEIGFKSIAGLRLESSDVVSRIPEGPTASSELNHQTNCGGSTDPVRNKSEMQPSRGDGP